MSGELVLVTGISGFIAKHCAVEMLRHGYRVRGTVRSLDKADGVRRTLAEHADISRLEFAVADLTSDASWAEAMQDVWGVLHLASPFPIVQPKDANELIRPAVDGTLRILRAAAAEGVQRFVQTSSTASLMYGHGRNLGRPFTEDDWTVANGPNVSAYSKSKTLAERAARDFVAEQKPGFHFATVNPGFVLGPLLDEDAGSSADAIAMFLKGKYPGCVRLSFPVVDVRDVAKLHRLALETTEPSGGRYVAVSETAWFLDMMKAIKGRLGDRARKVPAFNLPDVVVRIIALFDANARAVLPDVGKYYVIDNSRTRKALGVDFIPVDESAPAMAESLLRFRLA